MWGSKKGIFFILCVYQREILHKNVITVGGKLDRKFNSKNLQKQLSVLKSLNSSVHQGFFFLPHALGSPQWVLVTLSVMVKQSEYEADTPFFLIPMLSVCEA
jgi:hypothetical protein